MPDVFEQRRAFSNEVFSRFQGVADAALGSLKEETAIALTGSIAKDKLSVGSDLDVLVFTEDAIAENRARINECVAGIHLPNHPLEIYVTANREEWKWLLRHSELIASDVYFSKFAAGNQRLYEDIISIAEQGEIDRNNQRNYFTYNWIYRERQLKRKTQTSLKYRPGGFREVQLVDWIARRLLGSKNTHPEDQLAGMINAGLVQREQAPIVVDQYAKLLQAKADPDVVIDDAVSLRVWETMEQVRETVLSRIAPSGEWVSRILATIRDGAYPSADKQGMEDVSQLLCAIWDTTSVDALSAAHQTHLEDWAVRAALALNRNTPSTVVQNLRDLDFLDMPDIHKFLRETHGL